MPHSFVPIMQQPCAVLPKIISFGHFVSFVYAATHIVPAVSINGLCEPHLLSDVQQVLKHAVASIPVGAVHASLPHMAGPGSAGHIGAPMPPVPVPAAVMVEPPVPLPTPVLPPGPNPGGP